MDKEDQFKNKRDAALSEMSYQKQNNILLQAILDVMMDVRELKKTQISNQGKFERKWSKAKVFGAVFLIASPLISLVTGIIDPAVDFPVIADRAAKVGASIVKVIGG